MGKLWDYERIINEMGPFVKLSLTYCRLETEPCQIFQILAFTLCMQTAILSWDKKTNNNNLCLYSVFETI